MIKILKKSEEPRADPKKELFIGPYQHTTSPTTTGQSVIGLFYKDGVIIATDREVSYGSLHMYRDVQRLSKLNEWTAFGSSGEYSDFQEVTRTLTDMDK